MDVEDSFMDKHVYEAMLKAMKGYLSSPMEKLKDHEHTQSLKCIAGEF